MDVVGPSSMREDGLDRRRRCGWPAGVAKDDAAVPEPTSMALAAEVRLLMSIMLERLRIRTYALNRLDLKSRLQSSGYKRCDLVEEWHRQSGAKPQRSRKKVATTAPPWQPTTRLTERAEMIKKH